MFLLREKERKLYRKGEDRANCSIYKSISFKLEIYKGLYFDNDLIVQFFLAISFFFHGILFL